MEAFQVLLSQPDAEAVFADLHRRALTPGRLYALCGLQLLRSPRYAEQELLRLDERVAYQAGCVSDGRSAREIISTPEPNAMRLRPGETPADATAVPDIAGGGFPEFFRGAP